MFLDTCWHENQNYHFFHLASFILINFVSFLSCGPQMKSSDPTEPPSFFIGTTLVQTYLSMSGQTK